MEYGFPDNQPINFGLCIPVLNPGPQALEMVAAIRNQDLQPSVVLVVDSSSTDGYVDVFSTFAAIHTISPRDFDHGRVRQWAVNRMDAVDVCLFLTQDSIPANPQAFRQILAAFSNPNVGSAFGRQLPSPGAGPIGVHARLFNYPPVSQLKAFADIPSLGIKAAFISNSFAAYRRSALEAVGGFPSRCIVSEDTFVAARMLLAGWQIAYCAGAQVFHSHNYGYLQEFQRYFDIGVFHTREQWVRQRLGGAEGEGRRFFASEMKFLMGRAPHLLLSACLRTCIKYLGYRIGLAESFLPLAIKRRLSMQKSYWGPKFKGPSNA